MTRATAMSEQSDFAKDHADLSLDALAEIAKKDPDDNVRVAAAVAILDRIHGEPRQAVTGEGGGSPVRVVVEAGN